MDAETPKIKGRASLYRTLGTIGTVSTLILSLIWIILCLAGLIFYFAGGPCNTSTDVTILSPFTHSLVAAYFNKELSYRTPTTLHPHVVAGLITVYLILSVNLVYASFITYKVFHIWEQPQQIKNVAKYWTFSAIAMGLYELIFACVFIGDFGNCSYKPNGEYIAAAALFMATLALKGYFMWAFNLALCLTLFYIHFIKRKCPV